MQHGYFRFASVFIYPSIHLPFNLFRFCPSVTDFVYSFIQSMINETTHNCNSKSNYTEFVPHLCKIVETTHELLITAKTG